MDENLTIHRVRRIGTGLAFITFPIMLLIGFLLHPNFLMPYIRQDKHEAEMENNNGS